MDKMEKEIKAPVFGMPESFLTDADGDEWFETEIEPEFSQVASIISPEAPPEARVWILTQCYETMRSALARAIERL